MAIKSVLREELENSRNMLQRYNEELEKLPRGSIVERRINGNRYFYLIYRTKGKFISKYLGKEVEVDKLNEYGRAKALRKKYRHSISVLKKQIRFLEGALRGKEEI